MNTDPPHEPRSVGTWAKRYYYANRAAVEAVLPLAGVGSTQWAVLYELTTSVPTSQRDLGALVQVVAEPGTVAARGWEIDFEE